MSSWELLQVVDTCVVHHSASPRDTTTLEQIRRWHVEGNRWRDVGYHYVIDAEGVIHVGRPLPRMGAHCRGHNRSSVGVCLVGDNTRAGEMWNDAQLAALRELIAALRTVWPEITVCGHRDAPGQRTACPGVDLAAWGVV